MRELIDRQTAMKEMMMFTGLCLFRDNGEPIINESHPAIKAIQKMPTVMRISDERYQRLIGKKVKA